MRKQNKPNLFDSIGQVVDLFGASRPVVQAAEEVSVEKRRKHPSEQSFTEALSDTFQSIGDDLRWSIDDFKKTRTG